MVSLNAMTAHQGACIAPWGKIRQSSGRQLAHSQGPSFIDKFDKQLESSRLTCWVPNSTIKLLNSSHL